MTQREVEFRKTLEILLDELQSDDEFRDAFVRRPRTTLRHAGEWGVALTDSELYSLIAAEQLVFDAFAAAVGGEFIAAA